MSTVIKWLSPRGMPLVWMQPPLDVPVLTVENYIKWYELFVLHPSGQLESVDFGKLEDICPGDETAFCDHVPNPILVRRLALKNNWHMDPNALEMIIGRWELEYLESYEFEPEDRVIEDEWKDFDLSKGEFVPSCPTCGGPGEVLGALGKREHYRCRNCGSDFSQESH